MSPNNKEEEKNVESKFHRGASYNSNITNNDDKKIETNANEEFVSRNEKRVGVNSDNKNNIPVRLRYKIAKNNKESIKKSIDMDDQDDINNNNQEEVNGRNKKYNMLFTSADGLYSSKNSNSNGRNSKDTSTHGSKGSMAASSKDNYAISNFNMRKDRDTQ